MLEIPLHLTCSYWESPRVHKTINTSSFPATDPTQKPQQHPNQKLKKNTNGKSAGILERRGAEGRSVWAQRASAYSLSTRTSRPDCVAMPQIPAQRCECRSADITSAVKLYERVG